MAYCNGICEYLNERKHRCEKTGEKLAYVKGRFGITHEHVGYLECDEKNNKTEND